MIELYIKFKDAEGNVRRVLIDQEKFAIGRHSQNQLSIADGRLSREHALIERFGEIFVVTDRGSSNGTEVNGKKLTEPVALNAGDSLSLGGFEIELEFVSADNDEPETEAAAEPQIGPSRVSSNTVTPDAGGFPKSFFFIAPILGLIILAVIGIVIYNFGGKTSAEDNSNFIYPDDQVDPPRNRKGRNENTVTISNGTVIGNSSPVSSNNTVSPTPSSSVSPSAKTEQNAASFLRKAAQNDPTAFITGEQAKIVDSKIRSLTGSSALADNINSARRNSAQIKALAISKNLKPQFLAVAAITKLGISRGDVLQTAQSIADVLDKLGTQVGSEFGEDCLLMMAAFDQGLAGDFMKMRNMLQDLATKSPESSRAIRTIWFLKKNGKISDAEYDLAVRFLAVGTITQNPRDFGVNTEALVF